MGLALNTTLQMALLAAPPMDMAQGNRTYDAWPQRNFEAIFSRQPHP